MGNAQAYNTVDNSAGTAASTFTSSLSTLVGTLTTSQTAVQGSIAVAPTATAGVPLVASAGVTVTATIGVTTTDTVANNEQTTQTFTISTEVPAGSVMCHVLNCDTVKFSSDYTINECLNGQFSCTYPEATCDKPGSQPTYATGTFDPSAAPYGAGMTVAPVCTQLSGHSEVNSVTNCATSVVDGACPSNSL